MSELQLPAWVSLLPPIVAIFIAIWKREVILALVVGLFFAEFLLADLNLFSAFTGTLEQIVAVFQSKNNSRILLFSLLVGALIAFMQQSGGVSAFVAKLTRQGLTKTPRQASFMTVIIGIVIFIETNLSILTAGITSQRLFDKFKMSRERLAFMVDSTCSPISVLILLNGWGAYILGLITPYHNDSLIGIVAGSILFNFYPIIILLMVFFTAYTGKVFGPMRHVENNYSDEKVIESEPASKAHYMLLPLFVLVISMVFFMWHTGDGNIVKGSGAKAVLWAVSLAILTSIILLAKDKVYTPQALSNVAFSGMAKLLPLVFILLLSIAIGSAIKQLGTGEFIADLFGPYLPALFLAPLLFICGGVLAFTTGTSWGTFALLIPLGVPLGIDLSVPPSLILGAILGGGVFGDHCSPISDSTVLSSLASGCDHLSHVRTQLPYALTAGGLAIIAYLIIGYSLL